MTSAAKEPGSEYLVEDDLRLRRILSDHRSIAVVGASSDPSRPSYDVTSYLLSVGYRIQPVNPREVAVLGVPALPDLHAAAALAPLEIVQIFRRPDQVAPHVDEAIAAGAKVLWLQIGVIDDPAARRAHAAGLQVVMNRCMLRDHMRLMSHDPA